MRDKRLPGKKTRARTFLTLQNDSRNTLVADHSRVLFWGNQIMLKVCKTIQLRDKFAFKNYVWLLRFVLTGITGS